MTDWNDRTDLEVRDKLARRCPICKTAAGDLCTNMPISADPLIGRLVHYGR